MLDFLRLFLHVLAAPFRTEAQLEAEITLLRRQLNVLQRQASTRPRVTAADRLLFVWLCRLFPSLRNAILKERGLEFYGARPEGVRARREAVGREGATDAERCRKLAEETVCARVKLCRSKLPPSIAGLFQPQSGEWRLLTPKDRLYDRNILTEFYQ